jgi:hypothetical protein
MKLIEVRMFKFFTFMALLISSQSSANSLVIENVTVTKIQVYESTNDSVNAWIFLNGNGRVGVNPKNNSYTCELWTNDKSVHATALAALLAKNKVSVSYVDRGEGTYWCKVESLGISALY